MAQATDPIQTPVRHEGRRGRHQQQERGPLPRFVSKQQMDDHSGLGLWRGPRQSRYSEGSARTTDDPTRLEDSRVVMGSVDLADPPRR